MTSSIRILADNAVVRPDGSVKLAESMFSTTADLTRSAAVVASRIHPAKAAAYLSMLEGPSERHVTVAEGLTPGVYRVDPEIEIYVNGAEGLVRRGFSELTAESRELVERGTCAGVVGTVQLDGFDPGYEPVLRHLENGTSLLLFAALPPFTTQADRGRAARFDLQRFGSELMKHLDVQCTWDDREVFVIAAPADEVVQPLRAYVRTYWETIAKAGGPRPRGFWARFLGR